MFPQILQKNIPNGKKCMIEKFFKQINFIFEMPVHCAAGYSGILGNILQSGFSIPFGAEYLNADASRACLVFSASSLVFRAMITLVCG